MRKLLMFGILFAAIAANSQKTVDVNKEGGSTLSFNNVYTVAGIPFVNSKFVRIVEGTPFFKEQMMKGAIILSGGKEYKNIKVRLNLLESEVNYLGEKEIEMVASTPIKEVVLWDTVYGNDYRFVYSEYIEASDRIEKDFYELLQTGKVELYKQYKKVLMESKPYGSATVEQKIQTLNNFFLLKEGHWKKIKKLKDLGELLNDKAADVKQFITSNQIAGDIQVNYERVIAYYNSLFNH